ncbi:nuclear transcription factor Y subunit B-6-like [Mangifera indica]|uniref:nuclear transcription factor Y subunit B-6-like n=1 Tax=Mangifera indica TaxID=29780 RepID=UPI001CFBC74C|nr:nuclear transcription factor Y subunit B-6-like [Mangifera indica]
MECTGGFHGYRQLPNTASSGLKLTEMHNKNHISSSDGNECTVREQDRFMPIANVTRIMRKILPPHAKISDDAKETIQECVSEYISFITGEANEHCQRERRKTITAEDVLWAMSKLGLDDYIEPLTIYLHRYREMEGERGGPIRGEPLMKRAVEYRTLGAAAFHMGHHHQGFHREGGMGGYLKDANGNVNGNGVGSASSSQGALANGGNNGEAYAQHK